jgi:hypothetical protein
MNDDRSADNFETTEEDLRETSTRTRDHVIPAGYGTIGGPLPGEAERSDDRESRDES